MYTFNYPDDPYLSTFLIVYAVIILMGLTLGVAQYVMEAIALSRMAKSCRYPRPWLAWIPYANSYLIGKLAELSAVRFGKKKRPYGIWMIALQIAGALLSSVYLGVMTAAMLEGLSVAEYSASTIAGGTDTMTYAVFAMFPLMGMVSVLSILQVVVQFLALHLVFMLFDEKNAILYVILSLFVSLALPIILLILSRKAPNPPKEAPGLPETPSAVIS